MPGYTSLVLLLVLGIQTLESRYLEVGPGIYSFTDNGFYVSVFVVTGDGVVAMESVNPKHSAAMIKDIKEVTDEPIKFLIQSHNHWDHTGGNGLFRDEGAKIVAHAEAVEWMEENRHPDVVIPDTTWLGDEYWISLGNQTIQLINLGLSHGVGNAAAFLPNEKFLFAADFLSPDRLPFAIAPDYNFKEWEENLEKILTLDWDKAVHTHTSREEPLEVSPKKDMEDGLQYLKDLKAEVKSARATNPNMAAIPGSIKLPKYESWSGYKEFLALNAWKSMMEQSIGSYVWRPRKKRSDDKPSSQPSPSYGRKRGQSTYMKKRKFTPWGTGKK